MRLVKLSEIFNVKNGITSNKIKDIFSENMKEEFTIPYIRPSYKLTSTIAGYLHNSFDRESYIFPQNSLFVSTNGEGSHSYAYVSPINFVPNSDVAVLLPKVNLTLVEKQYYATCITHNRYKFSYGRKPKGKRLANILVPHPEDIPSWVYEFDIENCKNYEDYKSSAIDDELPELNVERWEPFKLGALFELKSGKGPSADWANKNNGLTPFITATSFNNGVCCFTDFEATTKANILTISKNGSVGECFYHENPICSSSDIMTLQPKFKMNVYIGHFLSAVIKQEKPKYNYGRKWNGSRMKNSVIYLPITQDHQPDWALMENYVKTLPYSKHL